MQNQALVLSKDKSKKLKCRLLQFLFGKLRVKREKAKNRRRLKMTEPAYTISCPGAFGSGELKIYMLFVVLRPR